MPQNTRKKKPSHKKRVQITDSAGWTHVVNGHKAAPSTEGIANQFSSLSMVDDVPPAAIAERQQKNNKAWSESQCCKDLSRLLEDKVLSREDISIDSCVCLGLGSFTAGRDSSSWELSALIWMLEFLQTHHEIQEVFFQDPVFNQSDTNYLESLGYTVLDTPLGLNKITQHTFLFAPHLEHNIYALALDGSHPALCIGSEIETFVDGPAASPDDEARKREGEIFSRFSETMMSRPMPAFERDTWTYFTGMYWLKAGHESRGSK